MAQAGAIAWQWAGMAGVGVFVALVLAELLFRA